MPFSWSQEILAGITVGLIALPLALALGVASIPTGVETPLPAPALGIITAILGGFLVAVFSGCRVQIGGPTAAFIPIVLAIIQKHGYSGLLLATMMAGVILIVMGIARLGSLIKYIPWPVTSGFTTGIAVSIFLTQVPDALGLTVNEAPPQEFFEKLHWLFHHISSLNGYSVALTAVCLGIIFFWPRLKIRRVPGSIVAILAATLWIGISGWDTVHGVSTLGSKFGSDAIPRTLPSWHWPEISWPLIRDLLGPAISIALLGAIESLLCAVVADGLTGSRHNSNTELIAQGIANLVCPFFCGLPVTGAIARTSANVNNGGKTPLAGVFHAITLLTVILLAAKWIVYIPLSAMAAVLIAVAFRMGEWHELTRLRRMLRSDALVLLTTFALTVLFDLVIAVQAGMALAAILYIHQVSETTEVHAVTDADLLERPEHLAQGKPLPPGVVTFRIFGPFLFGAAEKMEDALAQIGEWPRVLILRLHLVTAMDATGLNALISVVERMHAHGSSIILSGIHHQPLSLLRRAGFIEVIGRENFCATFDDAIRRAEALVKKTPETKS